MTNIQATIKVNKAQAKSNITHSVSLDRVTNMFRSINITGSLVSCEGFVTSDKVNLDKQVVSADVGTTLLISEERVGKKLINTIAQIYAERAENGDKNPTIEINFTAETFSITKTNILAKGITELSVNADAQLVDSSEQALANLQVAKTSSKNGALSAARAAGSMVGRFIKQTF